MVRLLLIAATLGLLLTAFSSPVTADPDPAGNGIVMMVHGHFEPWVEGPPPAAEALVTTVDDGKVLLHTITYSADDAALPVAVNDPVLRIVTLDGDVEEVPANGDPLESDICVLETNLPGHEGPIEACAVFEFDAEDFDGRNVVFLELLFTDENGRDGIEVYNVVAHYLLHAWIESGGQTVDLETADEMFADPTPYVVENVIDPVS